MCRKRVSKYASRSLPSNTSGVRTCRGAVMRVTSWPSNVAEFYIFTSSLRGGRGIARPHHFPPRQRVGIQFRFLARNRSTAAPSWDLVTRSVAVENCVEINQ